MPRINIVTTPVKYKEPSVCESCGEEFACGATFTGCWCMDIKVSDDAREEMKEKFSKCLCPTCLGGYETIPAKSKEQINQ